MKGGKVMTKGELLNEITKLDFVLTELRLYLNTHPLDTRVLNMYDENAQRCKALKDVFNNQYGPLSDSSINSSASMWMWINDPWPWEEEFNAELY